MQFAVKFALVACYIGEVFQTAGVCGLVHREGVFGPFQVGDDGFHRPAVQVRPDVGLRGRHPGAEEHIDLVVLQGFVGVRHRQAFDLGTVAQIAEQQAGHCGGNGYVGPANVGETHHVANGGVGGLGRQRGSQGCRQQPIPVQFHGRIQ
ncbi:hypothetical protein D9M68_834460 [compost metagenome]